MLKSLVDLVLRVTDLAEAEGRVAMANAIRLLVLTSVLLACALAGFAAVVGLAAALVLAMADIMSVPAAIAIVSSLLLVATLLCASFVVRRTRSPLP